MTELDAIFWMAANTARPQQTHLATYVVTPAQLRAHGSDLVEDAGRARAHPRSPGGVRQTRRSLLLGDVNPVRALGGPAGAAGRAFMG